MVADLDVFVKLNKNTQVYSLKEFQLIVRYAVYDRGPDWEELQGFFWILIFI